MNVSSKTVSFTADLSRLVLGIDSDRATETAYLWARHALLDYCACAIAGSRQPLSDKIIGIHGGSDGTGCTVAGREVTASPMDAALINGTLAHALDYDDVNSRGRGHPSVAIVPAVLALAEDRGASGRETLLATLAGHEAFAQIGDRWGLGHYDRGFHATGTLGTFASAAACAHLIGLKPDVTRRALGIAATQASGLKTVFGTMAKPLNAGLAAQAGLRAALLAEAGFTAPEDAIEASQGFADTQCKPVERESIAPIEPLATRPFAIEETQFKFHASCFLTHAPIEAVSTLREGHGLRLHDLDRAVLWAHPGIATVCDIAEPETGLQVKFSVRHLMVLALDGCDTSDPTLYTDEIARRPRYVDKRSAVEVRAFDFPNKTFARVVLHLKDGRAVEADCDLDRPCEDPALQGRRLSKKAAGLVDPVLGAGRGERLGQAVDRIIGMKTIRELTEALR